MPVRQPRFTIRKKVWRYPGAAGWYFVTLDKALADEIRFVESVRKVGLGYVCVKARVGRTRWSTTLFPTKEKEFLLAIKAAVRKAEGIGDGDMIEVEFEPELETGRKGGKNVRPDW
jgi:hypothetical protein